MRNCYVPGKVKQPPKKFQVDPGIPIEEHKEDRRHDSLWRAELRVEEREAATEQWDKLAPGTECDGDQAW